MDNPQYGKRITTIESFADGKETRKQLAYSLPVKITGKSQMLTEIISALDLIVQKQTRVVTLIVRTDRDFNPNTLIKEYAIDQPIDNKK